ncbi:hypothetical protein [Deinococcus gobiensis]|uniref:Uncharacterized protein n=1 Tax=Deinococcus gobiensis (strain DSM 21396 / JCM 16679 / CGMCC 1.7299 / I-0) TaxID=745776 RepID=H8H2B8_DEIGI|nr:hypothetical protein [Deinococcus gobiensis]AFD27665.1 hypothetical protein DGo_PB0396 [Deinococcus gobiensis I-0]
MTRYLLPLFLTLSGVVSAGGVEPINRNQPLYWVPGASEVFSVSADQIVTKAFTNALTLRSEGQRIQVFVTTGIISDDPGASAINNIQAWVQSPTASPAQKQALIQVAQTYLRGCSLQVTPRQLAALVALKEADWTQGGWQKRTVEGVTLGWSDGNGFGFSDGPQGRKPRAALSVEWPVKTSRCQF